MCCPFCQGECVTRHDRHLLLSLKAAAKIVRLETDFKEDRFRRFFSGRETFSHFLEHPRFLFLNVYSVILKHKKVTHELIFENMALFHIIIEQSANL